MERFDGPARAAIEGAYRAARELEHSQVGTEHLLLGILAQSGTRAAGALTACGATLDGCRVKVAEAVASKRPGSTAPDLTLTDRASLALERAGRLSLRQRCDHVEARHILLSVLDVEGTAGQVLRGLAVDPDRVRQRLKSSTDQMPPPAPAPSPVVEPAGTMPQCPQCGSSLDSTLAHRMLDSRDERGRPAAFVVVYCSSCGRTISALPANIWSSMPGGAADSV
jgi:ATP-dependent Clp protease ATP-binding subunit ClpA